MALVMPCECIQHLFWMGMAAGMYSQHMMVLVSCSKQIPSDATLYFWYVIELQAQFADTTSRTGLLPLQRFFEGVSGKQFKCLLRHKHWERTVEVRHMQIIKGTREQQTASRTPHAAQQQLHIKMRLHTLCGHTEGRPQLEQPNVQWKRHGHSPDILR